MEAKKPQLIVLVEKPAILATLADLIKMCGYSTALYESIELLVESDSNVNVDCLFLRIRSADMTWIDLHDTLVQARLSPPLICITLQNDTPTICYVGNNDNEVDWHESSESYEILDMLDAICVQKPIAETCH